MIVKVDDIVYGVDMDGFRWSIPVAQVVAVKEQQGWNSELGALVSFASVWPAAAGTYLGGSIEDTMEDVHMTVFGVAWPAGAPQAPETP